MRKELRALKKVFKKRKNKKGTKVIRILLTLLVIWVASGLGGLIAILSCNLQCSGQPGMATAVAIGGFLVIVTLVAFILHKIWRENLRQKYYKN